MKNKIKQTVALSLFILFQLAVFPQMEEVDVDVKEENQAELAVNQLVHYQKAIKSTYQKENFKKCIRKSSERLDKGLYDKVAYYYLGLSTFKIYEGKLNEVLFDKSLIYLSSSDLNNDQLIMSLKNDDQPVLNQIHMLAIQLSIRDLKKHRGKAMKRLKYVEEIFQDTIDIYEILISLEAPKLINNNSNNEISLDVDNMDLFINKTENISNAKLESFELLKSTSLNL